MMTAVRRQILTCYRLTAIRLRRPHKPSAKLTGGACHDGIVSGELGDCYEGRLRSSSTPGTRSSLGSFGRKGR